MIIEEVYSHSKSTQKTLFIFTTNTTEMQVRNLATVEEHLLHAKRLIYKLFCDL